MPVTGTKGYRDSKDKENFLVGKEENIRHVCMFEKAKNINLAEAEQLCKRAVEYRLKR